MRADELLLSHPCLSIHQHWRVSWSQTSYMGLAVLHAPTFSPLDRAPFDPFISLNSARVLARPTASLM